MKEAFAKIKHFKKSNIVLPGLLLLIASVLTLLNFFLPQTPKSTAAKIANTKSSKLKKAPLAAGTVHAKTDDVALKTSVPSPDVTITPSVSQASLSAGSSASDSNISTDNEPSQSPSSDSVSENENTVDTTPTATQNNDQAVIIPTATPMPKGDQKKNDAVITNSVGKDTPTHVNDTGFATGGTSEVGNTIVAVGASSVGQVRSDH